MDYSNCVHDTCFSYPEQVEVLTQQAGALLRNLDNDEEESELL